MKSLHEGLRLQIVDPRDEYTIQSAHALILRRAQEGHVFPRSLDQVKEIASRCAAAYLNNEGDVVAFGGITREYSEDGDPAKPIVAAEYGAMVTASGYERNGFSSDVTQAVAQHYLANPQQQQRLAEFLLFAMTHVEGPGRRVFDKLHVPEIPNSLLPTEAFCCKDEYYNFGLNGLRRERPE